MSQITKKQSKEIQNPNPANPIDLPDLPDLTGLSNKNSAQTQPFVGATTRRVGIYEALEPNHVPTLNALIKSYNLIPNTEVVAFISKAVQKQLAGLDLEQLATFVVKEENESNKNFLKRISEKTYKEPLNRIHICSTRDKFKDFFKFTPNLNGPKEIFLHIHNTDVWFRHSYKYHTETLLHDLIHDESERKKINIIAKFIKNLTLRSFYITRILKNYSQKYNLNLVVQNSNIEKTIPKKSKFLTKYSTTIFPFSCYEPKLISESKNSNKIIEHKVLTVGICGMVSQERRDYLGLFNALKKANEIQRTKIEFRLLGYINPREIEKFQREIKLLKELGIKVTECSNNKTSLDYQENMRDCDILLNLVKIRKGAHSKYSETKESGMIGDMISSAKPGLIPKEYYIENTFKQSTLTFHTITEMLQILEELVSNKNKLTELSYNAQKASQTFTPEILKLQLSPQN